MAGWRALYAVAAAILAAYFANFYLGWVKAVPPPDPVVAGLLFLLFTYLLIAAGSRTQAIWNSVRGEDGRASTSKFQIFLWTVVVLFAYVAIAAARWEAGQTDPLPDMPQSVLAALGISLGTATAAAAVTANNTNTSKEVKVPATNQGIAPIFQTDDGQLDLNKLQLMAWTILAISVFLGLVFQELASPEASTSLPDIDPTLMVLTGLGSATYIGRKLITTSRPFLSARSADSVKISGTSAERTIVLSGFGFGSAGTGQVTIGGVALLTPAAGWTDTSITLEIPSTRPDGSQWPPDQPLDIVVLTATGPTQNALTIRFTP